MDVSRSGVLLLRVWTEPEVPEMRARLIRAVDVEETETSVAAAGIDGICEAVRSWLEQLGTRIPARDGSVTPG
jgi:hypothetical protein